MGKSIYQNVTLLATLLLFLPFNNCTRFSTDLNSKAEFSSESDLSWPNLQSSATSISLSGAMITQNLASGCTPAVSNDFFETVKWEKRRIEPKPCSLVKISTPVFSWPIPPDMNRNIDMVFTLNQTTTNKNFVVTTKTPRLIFRPGLSSGMYQWKVQYTATNGTIRISDWRRFVIDQGTLLALPTGVELAATVAAKSHPRALPANVSFATIAARAVNPSYEYDKAYSGFLAAAVELTVNPGNVIPAPPANKSRADFPDDSSYVAWTTSLKQTAMAETAAIETLGYAAKFTNSTDYQNRAIQRLVSLAQWPTNGATSEDVQDQANREICMALALGLDLYRPQMSASQISIVVSSLKSRLTQITSKFAGFDTYPYESHLLTAVRYATEILMYVAAIPEYPEAQGLLASTWELFATTLSSWGGETDGGYANGTAYGWYDMTGKARIAAALSLMTTIDVSKWPALALQGYNQIAFMPATGRLRGQFGDDTETDSHYYDYVYDSYRLLARATNNSHYEAYWRADSNVLKRAFTVSPFHFLFLGVNQNKTAANVLPNSFLFEDAGLVAMHSNTNLVTRSSLFFRSSRFGSFNHSHADNNAFTLVSKGQPMLISGGYYPFYNSNHHANITRATRFKNALTFDNGIGQSEPTTNPTSGGAPVDTMDAHGQLINYFDNGTWALATGDATLAYRGQDKQTGDWSPLLSSAFRTVAYNRAEGVFIIYDWARDNSRDRTWELNFQSLTDPTLSNGSVKISNGASNICIDMHAPSGSYTYSQGFGAYPPESPKQNAPTQYHIRYSTLQKSRELTAVTVIREDCRNVPVNVSFSDSYANIKINGTSIIMDGRNVTIP